MISVSIRVKGVVMMMRVVAIRNSIYKFATRIYGGMEVMYKDFMLNLIIIISIFRTYLEYY